jgi:formiminotetrahydrofolate cyclodeaminase
MENQRLSIAYASLWNLTATEVRDQVASISPTPGGGSVSIMTATFGVALVQKGTNISLKRPAGDLARQQSLLDLQVTISSSMESLSRFADADSSAFQSYVKACSLPRVTETEKAARKASMDESLLCATQIPLESAAEMVRGLELAETAVKVADAYVLSDIFAGALLLHASIRSVLLNVDANLPGIPDVGVGEILKQQRAGLERASTLRAEAVAEEFQTRVLAAIDR